MELRILIAERDSRVVTSLQTLAENTVKCKTDVTNSKDGLKDCMEKSNYHILIIGDKIHNTNGERRDTSCREAVRIAREEGFEGEIWVYGIWADKKDSITAGANKFYLRGDSESQKRMRKELKTYLED